MKTPTFETIDGNEAAARVAYALNEVIAIYPITPASPMGEWADAWATTGRKNLWGTVPSIIEMQSEGGAAGAIHGALQTGALATTFTASQGLLLMIPNMFKIAGELTPAVFHIAARSIAAQALSIFGDHSDVMAARSTGWAMLCSASVQEAQDFALISQAATMESRIPFLHFFDGFRTSHELAKIELLDEETLRAMTDDGLIRQHRERALSPDHPTLRGTAQNPDVFFQARERVNPFYAACPEMVQRAMDRFASLTGRQYRLFEYHGAPDAERVVVLMGSGCETARATVDWLNSHGEKVGVLKVRLFRPFDSARAIAALPPTAKAIAVLDRTKEPGGVGEPLYLDAVTALYEAGRNPTVVGGRYGLSSKEFTPAMLKAVFDNLAQPKPKNHFTVGIRDDVAHTSLEFDEAFGIEADETFRALFYGLGSDGTVGANKESIKIIGENTDHYAQGFFVYDSKKAGAVTVSHLRFGPRPIRAPYLISQAHFVGCHQSLFLERFDVAEQLQPRGVLLLNSPCGPEDVWRTLPEETQRSLIAKRARLFVIDANRVARECGMSGRINTVMQVCFFSVSGVLPHNEAIAAIQNSIRKSYGKKGEEIVQMNLDAVDNTLAHLYEVKIPSAPGSSRREEAHSEIRDWPGRLKSAATEFERVTLPRLLAGRGDAVPVSALPADGTFPTGTARWEKRNLATEIPVWDPDVCIQCGKCVLVCPHAVIRSKVYEPAALASAPATFKSRDARLPEWSDQRYELHWHTLQGTESYPEALSYFPDPHELSVGPEAYLQHIAKAKETVAVPIIASLNGSTPGGWTSFAKQIQQAGADALELNLYSVPTDMEIVGADLEKQFIDVLKTVKGEVTIPVAVKLSPFFTNFANMAKRFDEGGANGLVLFNRFYQPDIELESLEVVPNVMFSTPMAMRLPMRWIAILYDRVSASLAATSGIHRGTDALKMLMAGADVTMLCSALMRHGIDRLRVIEEEMVNWMREHEYESVEQLKGSLSHKNCPDPSAFERAQYMRAVGVHKPA